MYSIIKEVLTGAFIMVYTWEKLSRYYFSRKGTLGNNPHPCADHRRRLDALQNKVDMIRDDIIDIKIKMHGGGD